MKLPALTAGCFFALAWVLAADEVGFGKSSLSELDIEFSEAKVSLETATEENALLKRELANARASVRSLTESLAIANGEAEEFRKQAGELMLRLEALGISAGSSNQSALEQRLLKAASDLRIAIQDRDKLAEHLVRLSEAAFWFVKSAQSSEPQARMALEAEMRSSAEALAAPTEDGAKPSGTLTEGRVISIKEELSLLVINVGHRQGVRVGMPFNIVRGRQKVASARVVDVREMIAGAVIQNLISDKEKVTVGDSVRVDAQ